MVETSAVFLKLAPKENLAEARRLAEAALRADDGLYEAHFAMARVLSSSDDIGSALSEFRKVVALDPQNGYAWCEMSAVLNNEDPVGAEIAAREAIRFRPAYSRGYLTLGAALQKQDRLSEAVDAFQQSLQLDPSNQGLRKVIDRLIGQLSTDI